MQVPIIGENNKVGKMLDSMQSAEAKISVDMTKVVEDFNSATGFSPGQDMKAADVVKMLHKLGVVK